MKGLLLLSSSMFGISESVFVFVVLTKIIRNLGNKMYDPMLTYSTYTHIYIYIY
jgi:hypothetical protein